MSWKSVVLLSVTMVCATLLLLFGPGQWQDYRDRERALESEARVQKILQEILPPEAGLTE